VSTNHVHFTVKLRTSHRWAIYLISSALFLTGAAWLVLDTWVRVEGAFGPEHHPVQTSMLALHGAAAFAFLVATGALIPVHIRLAWAARMNRTTGVATIIMGLLLAASGLLLYYASAESLRATASLIHWIIGLAAPSMLIVHTVMGRGTWRRWWSRSTAKQRQQG
jgi:hypothetical protein